MRPPVIVVGRTRRGSVAFDRRPAGMRLWQCGRERDAAAGDLCIGRVRKSERRSDGDCGAASAECDGVDNRRLMVCTTVNGDRLASAKACHAENTNYGRAHVGCGGRRGGA